MTTLRLWPVLLMLSLFVVPVAAQTEMPAATPAAQPRPDKPWPDPDTMQARRLEAEGRPLFAGADPFLLTLSADFKAINKDRKPDSEQEYPALLTVTAEDGRTDTLRVILRTRGHFRLRPTVCSFVPLRVTFVKDEVKGTLFDGQKTLKMVTHCQGEKEYEQYVLREHVVYRALNLLTPLSFRARLARATYVQAPDGKTLATRLAMFLEDDDELARRNGGRSVEREKVLFRDVDPETLTLTMTFAYMIGNTDFSLYLLHNLRLVRTPSAAYAVPYDFDLSGLVNTRYAIPARTLRLKSVRDRLYRGPCRTAEELEPVLERFRLRRTDILGLYDSLPDLDGAYRKEAKSYLEEFFRAIDRPGDVRRTFIEGQCSKKPSI